MDKAALLQIWRRALAEEFGVELRVKEPIVFSQDLYKARAEAKDPALEEVKICTMKDGTLWLVKRDLAATTLEEGNASPLP